jgi:hypothetical protein
MRHYPAAKIAAVLLFGVTISYVWKSAFFPSEKSHPESVVVASEATQQLDFANLPVSWPGDLMPMPQLTYLVARTRPRGSAPVRRDALSASKYDGGAQETKKGRNPFFRAFGRVAHPLHRADANRSSAATKVSVQP